MRIPLSLLIMFVAGSLPGQQRTYCNPVNIDYGYTPFESFAAMGGFEANHAVDEDIRTCWSAATGEQGEWIQTDLGEEAIVYAIQINYADQDAEYLGKTLGKSHKYVISGSNDREKWSVLVDKSDNQTDVPHEYIELESPVRYRYLKLVNHGMPTGKFAISGFRVFGKGSGEKPGNVENFVVLRSAPDRDGNSHASWLKWQQNPMADGYNIYFGKEPGKLYGSIMVYGANEYYFTGMDRTDPYYFQIEAFNENGISERSEVVKVD